MSVQRQLHWVVTELHRAGQVHPDPPPRCERWLVEPHLTAYLTLAESGVLRSRTSRRQDPSPATVRARRVGLRHLAAGVGVPLALGVGAAPPASGPDPMAAARFLSWLAADRVPVAVRSRAVAAVAAAGVGVSDLAALRLEQLEGRLLTAPLRAPGPAPAAAPARVHLVGWAAVAVEEWLTVRDQVAVSPRVREVFLTCAATHLHGAVYAAGLPVSARGLERAHGRVLDRYFPVLAGRVGPQEARRQVSLLRLGGLRQAATGREPLGVPTPAPR